MTRLVLCAISAPAVFVRGWAEGLGGVGMTYGNPYSRRSIAYDLGRSFRLRGQS